MPEHDAPAGSDADDELLLETVGTAFSKLRRRTMSVPVDPPVTRTDLRRDLFLTVVEEDDGRLTVNGVAARLMMERTAVSRLGTWCVEQGLVERVASPTDGRSATLRLTPRGREVLAHSRHQQRQAFEHITGDWSREDRVQLARLLHRYVDSARRAPQAET